MRRLLARFGLAVGGIAGALALMELAVRTSGGFEPGTPRLVTDALTLDDALFLFGFALTRDGEGFLYVEQEATDTPIRVVTNWFDELRAMVPTQP